MDCLFKVDVSFSFTPNSARRMRCSTNMFTEQSALSKTLPPPVNSIAFVAVDLFKKKKRCLGFQTKITTAMQTSQFLFPRSVQ